MTTNTLQTSPFTAEQAVDLAAALGREIAPHATRHDREGSFVDEAYEAMTANRYLALAVPTELGGLGAGTRAVSMAQRELARHCASAALASTMHHHLVLATAWRYRRAMPGAEATLRRVADEGIVLVSTGGADFTRPRGEAVRVDGGFRVSGRKIFASQAPAGSVMVTMFPYEDPEEGRIVLNTAVPMNADGVEVLDTWDAMGMRGTGSHDVELRDVFVPDDKVMARRPYGTIDPPLQIVVSVALLPIAAVYLGIAEAARDHAVHQIAGTPRAEQPAVLHSVGLMDNRLRVAGWALDGGLATVGDDPEPSLANVAAVMAAKREISLAAIEVCDLALDVAGGSSFYRTSPIEQCYRDVRGAKFHPFPPEETLLHAGKVALGLPADEW
jgi:acyl-CoA dehydrogenase